MKICHVITRMIIGGAQENTLFSCRGQIQAGHQVTLISGEETGAEGDLLTCQKVAGLQIKKISSLKRNLSLLDDYRAYRQLYRYFCSHEFDVVHTHSSKAGILARIAAYRAGVKVVVHTIHGLPFHRYEKWYKNWFYIFAERYASKFCQKIFSVADALTKEALQKKITSPQKYKTIRSGIDMNLCSSQKNLKLRQSLGISQDKVVVGKVARIFQLKGYEKLVQIAQHFKNSNVVFLIVGAGKLRPTIEKQIKKRNLGHLFIFVGLVKSEEVAQYISCMDILIHLSLHEGLPRVVVQALASSCPVVAYKLDGTPEVVKYNKSGFIYPPEQTQKLIEGLKSLVGDEKLRCKMGSYGRKLVIKEFTWQKMVADLNNEYELLLEQNKK